VRLLSSALFLLVVSPLSASAQAPDWSAVDAEALKTLQSYIRINTSVSPGDVIRVGGVGHYDALVETARKR
jgi:hypothetical protein